MNKNESLSWNNDESDLINLESTDLFLTMNHVAINRLLNQTTNAATSNVPVRHRAVSITAGI